MKYNFTFDNIKKYLITNKIVSNIFVFVIGFISALLFTQSGTYDDDTKLIEARLVPKCEAHFKAESPATGQDENALACYKKVLKTYPNNADALAGLEKIEARYVIWIEDFLERELLDKAELYLRKLLLLNPLSPKLAELKTQLRQQRIAPLLLKCQAHLNANRLTTGRSGNALSCYREVLTKDPNNAEALAGLKKIEARYVTMTEAVLKRGLQYKVKQYLERLHQVNPLSPKLLELETRLLQQRFGPEVSLEIGRSLLECQEHLNANRLTTGRSWNALSCYQDVLTKYPNNAFALAGIEKIEARYVTLIKKKLDTRQFLDAEKYLVRLRKVNPKSKKLAGLIEQCLEERLSFISWTGEEMERQISTAYDYFVWLRELKPNSQKLSEFKAQLLTALEEGIISKENRNSISIEDSRIFIGGLNRDGKYLAMLRSLNPKSLKLVEFETEFVELIEQMLEKGQLDEEKEYLTRNYLTKLHQINPKSPKLVDFVERFIEPVKQMIKSKPEFEMIEEANEYLGWLERLNLNSPKLDEFKLLLQKFPKI